jgi:hypothetical protein
MPSTPRAKGVTEHRGAVGLDVIRKVHAMLERPQYGAKRGAPLPALPTIAEAGSQHVEALAKRAWNGDGPSRCSAGGGSATVNCYQSDAITAAPAASSPTLTPIANGNDTLMARLVYDQSRPLDFSSNGRLVPHG